MIFFAFYRTRWKPPVAEAIDRFRIAQFLEGISESARADQFVRLNKKLLRVAIGCFLVSGLLFAVLAQLVPRPNDAILGLTMALAILLVWASCQIPILLISHWIASDEAASWVAKVMNETRQWMLCSLHVGNASNTEPKLMQLISSELLEKNSKEFARDLAARIAKGPTTGVDLSRYWEIAIRMLILHSTAQQKNTASCEICFSYLVAVGFDVATAPQRTDISFAVGQNGDVTAAMSKRGSTLAAQNWIISANAGKE